MLVTAPSPARPRDQRGEEKLARAAPLHGSLSNALFSEEVHSFVAASALLPHGRRRRPCVAGSSPRPGFSAVTDRQELLLGEIAENVVCDLTRRAKVRLKLQLGPL